MNQVLESHIEEIKILCQNYNVDSLYAIGEVCKDDFDIHEEIDLLIDFSNLTKEQFVNRVYHMTFLFERLLQRKVELLSWEDFGYLRVLEKQSPVLIYNKNNA